MDWGSLLSAAGGGAFGLIGAGVKLWGSYKDKQLTFKHEQVMAVETRNNMKMEMELAQIKGTIDLELQESTDDSANLRAAINAEASISGTSQWVGDLRGSTRPILTYLLVALAFTVVFVSPSNPWANELIFLASTAVTFWFGDRPRREHR